MSHFTVLVIGDNPEDQLAPFDENIVLPRYVEYTKEQLIEKGREKIKEYQNGLYAKFLADTEGYISSCKNDRHIKYIEEEFPQKLNWTDEEVYRDAIKYYEDDEIGPNGETYSTRNPKSKWDWYQLGGRWTGLIKLKPGGKGTFGSCSLLIGGVPGIDQAKKGDIDNLDDLVTFAVLKDGEWHERGEMGWFAIVFNEMDRAEWGEKVKVLLHSLPDNTLLSIYDCHI